MKLRVVDTNVLLVANNSHEGASPDCIRACVDLLVEIMKDGRLVLDDRRRILAEYLSALGKRRNKGVGDVFAKWVAQHLHNAKYVEEVALSEGPTRYFAEFPAQEHQESFDPNDRKFIATSNAHAEKPLVAQATDCKWIEFRQTFAASGVTIEFLCPIDICRFFQNKFPDADVPILP